MKELKYILTASLMLALFWYLVGQTPFWAGAWIFLILASLKATDLTLYVTKKIYGEKA